MILGIGVDIVHLPRIVAVLARRDGHRFANRILSSSELEQWRKVETTNGNEQSQARFLAVRWAVKEAAYKALYPTVKATWKELSYQGLSQDGRKPSLTYKTTNGESMNRIGQIHVSVSHDGEYATAYVTVEGKPASLRLDGTL